MFLAIAVDNLANAQELTAQQEEAERISKELKEKSIANEKIMFIPLKKIESMKSKVSETEKSHPGVVRPERSFYSITTVNSGRLASTEDLNIIQADELFQTRRVDIDYIPALDDSELQVILPGSL